MMAYNPKLKKMSDEELNLLLEFVDWCDRYKRLNPYQIATKSAEAMRLIKRIVDNQKIINNQ